VVNGFYYPAGTYNSHDLYIRQDLAYDMWYSNPDGKYVISADAGTKGAAWFVNGTATVPNGTYAAGGTATGTAEVV
jgi:hypothetical protein